MTEYTNNLRIPLLDQNVAQPEIPENTAKVIFDQIIGGQFTLDIPTDADYTFITGESAVAASDWQNGIIEIIDTTNPLSAPRNIILPNNKRTYIFINNTTQILTFKVSGQVGEALGVGKNMYAFCDGTDISKLEFIPSGSGSTVESMLDSPTGYGLAGQVLVSDGTNSFSYGDIALTFLSLTDVTPSDYTNDAGKAVIVNQTEDGLEFGVVGINLNGPNEITDDVGTDFGYLYTGTADIDYGTGNTTGTGIMYGTQGLVGINSNIEFFNMDPITNETLVLGVNTKVTHADASVTSLNNPEYMAQTAQRTADIALKNTMDINMAIYKR